MGRSMEKNFLLLKERIIDANKKVSQKELIEKLGNIKGNMISIGTGGSYPIAYYASIVMEKCNNCFTKCSYPRDLLYINKIPDNIISFSYSGKTPSIIQALKSIKSKKILFTIDSSYTEKIMNNNDSVINYQGDIPKEKSFISIVSTIIPITLLLKYSMKDNKDFTEDNFIELITDIMDKSEEYIGKLINNLGLNDFNTIEIFTGDNTYTSAYLLRSTIIESSMAYPIIHEKNDYCHGCQTFNYNKPTDLAIYLLGNKSKQDELHIKNVLPTYNKSIILEAFSNDELLIEFELTIKALFLLRTLAKIKNINLSNIRYPKELVRKLYYFKGKMK